MYAYAMLPQTILRVCIDSKHGTTIDGGKTDHVTVYTAYTPRKTGCEDKPIHAVKHTIDFINSCPEESLVFLS